MTLSVVLLTIGSVFCGLSLVSAEQAVQCKLEVLPKEGAVGRPGKRGAAGERGLKGQKGDAGRRGKETEIDEEVLQNLIESKVRQEIKSLEKKMKERMADMKQNILSTVLGRCPIFHNGRCFWAVLPGESTTPYTKAELLCKERGGRLADIYSKEQFDDMVTYAEHWLAVDSNGILGIFIAPRYDPQTNKLFASDGTEVAYHRWQSGNPLRGTQYREYERIFLAVSTTLAGGLSNGPSSQVVFGAFCQNEE